MALIVIRPGMADRPHRAGCARCGRFFMTRGNPFCSRDCQRAWKKETSRGGVAGDRSDYDLSPEEIERRFRYWKAKHRREGTFRTDGWDGWSSGLPKITDG